MATVTPAQLAMLQSIEDHADPYAATRGRLSMSAQGGATQTFAAIMRKGYADRVNGGDARDHYVLTDDGRAALAAG